jgi:hypothetical protein
MSVPTSFLDAQSRYQAQLSFDIPGKITTLNTQLNALLNTKNTNGVTEPQITATRVNVQNAFSPISNYFNEISLINDFFKNYIHEHTKKLTEDSSSSEERYKNRVHPEEAVLARESTYGLMPELRVRSLPYLLAISVFMASLTIFLIFQTFGFSGQVNLPSSITGWFSLPASPLPFYSNPLFLGGVVILLLVTVVIFAVLYFKSKNANK